MTYKKKPDMDNKLFKYITLRLKSYVHKAAFIIVVLALALFFTLKAAQADPEGASTTFHFNSNKTAEAASSRADPKGSINTIRLNSRQQNMKWKAYVGNVTSQFVLEDADGHSIYEWPVDDQYPWEGEVYISRDNTLTWANVGCAAAGNKSYEDSQINHDSTVSDSINKTFNDTIHQEITYAGKTIPSDTCFSTLTWQNDSYRYHTSGLPWEEILLWDNNSNSMIYTTFIDNDLAGYRNSTTYDFQAIVPDDGNVSQPIITYYFFMELT